MIIARGDFRAPGNGRSGIRLATLWNLLSCVSAQDSLLRSRYPEPIPFALPDFPRPGPMRKMTCSIWTTP